MNRTEARNYMLSQGIPTDKINEILNKRGGVSSNYDSGYIYRDDNGHLSWVFKNRTTQNGEIKHYNSAIDLSATAANDNGEMTRVSNIKTASLGKPVMSISEALEILNEHI